MNSKGLRAKVKEDYNSIAEEFSRTRQGDWREFEVFGPYLKKGMKVLDLGCGNGRLVNFLKPWKVNYTGFDQSDELVRLAKKAHEGVRFEVQDMASLLDVDEKWDVVFMVAAFHHLPRVEQAKVLQWVRSHLKKGGFLFMTNWNLFQMRFWKAWLKALLWPRFGFKGLLIPWNKGVQRYYYAFTPRELLGLLRRSGFELLQEQNGRNFVTITLV